MSKICANCGKKLGFLDQTITTTDKQIVGEECYSKVFDGGISALIIWQENHSFADFKSIYDQGEKIDLKEVNKQEKAAKKIKNEAAKEKLKVQELADKENIKVHNAARYGSLYFDNVDKKIVQLSSFTKLYSATSYSDIISYTPVDRGHNEKKKHGLLRAATGGALLGPAGAVIGAVTGGKNFGYVDELGVNISLKNGQSISIGFIKETTKQGILTDGAYKECNSLCALLDSILAENNNQSAVSNDQTSEDITKQLRKLKSLVDDGILTQDEFDAKKKQILKI